jgi:hypothetical protein
LTNTPTIQKVISTARLLVQLNRNQVSARHGLIVSGASGTGKTTALTQMGRTHERHTRKRHPADKHRLPVLYVTVPPAATARMLAVEFARFLGISFTGRANITDIVDAVCATAIRTRRGAARARSDGQQRRGARIRRHSPPASWCSTPAPDLAPVKPLTTSPHRKSAHLLPPVIELGG